MQALDSIVADMKRAHGVRIKRWRSKMSGCAWQVRYGDGRVVRWIEAPYPKTPISLCIFLHEVGHHAIGFETFSQRCEEEFHVWNWALAEMRAQGVAPDARVLRRVASSMRYEVEKALRRGPIELSDALLQFSKAA